MWGGVQGGVGWGGVKTRCGVGRLGLRWCTCVALHYVCMGMWDARPRSAVPTDCFPSCTLSLQGSYLLVWLVYLLSIAISIGEAGVAALPIDP